MQMLWPNSILILAGVLAVAGAVLLAAVAGVMAWTLLCPPRMTSGKAAWVLKRLSPGDLDLAFEEAGFMVTDRSTGRPMKVAAWWIPASRASSRCLVLIHGYGDAKVGALAWAPLLHEAGWNILAIDLRAHGESGGRYSTAGYWERHDVSQVIDQLRSSRPEETRTLGLFGISMGGATAAATAVLRNDIAGLVMESSFAGYGYALEARARMLGIPGGLAGRFSLKLAQWISGADFSAVAPVKLLGNIACPLLFINSGQDQFLCPADTAAMRQAIESRPPSAGAGIFWTAPSASHLMGLRTDPEEYSRQVMDFLARLG